MSQYIQFASEIIASDQLAVGAVPFAARLDAQNLTDVWQLFRATNATVYARGRGPRVLTFQVTRIFSTYEDATDFFHRHPETLPLQGTLTLVDSGAALAWSMASAAAQVRMLQRSGVAVTCEYTFTGAKFASDSVPAAPTDTNTVKAGSVDLSASDTSKAVTFDVAFASKPRYFAAIITIPGGGTVTAVSLDESYTSAGGTFRFASIPASGYKLRWVAFL